MISYYLDLTCSIKRTKLIKRKSLTEIPLNDSLLKLCEKQLFMYSLAKDLTHSHPLRQAYRRTRNLFSLHIHLSRASATPDRTNKTSNKSNASWEVIKYAIPNKSETSFSQINIIEWKLTEWWSFRGIREFQCILKCSLNAKITTMPSNITSTSFYSFLQMTEKRSSKQVPKTSKSSSLDCISSKLLQFFCSRASNSVNLSCLFFFLKRNIP